MRSFTGRMVIQFAVLVTLTIAAVLAAGRWFLSREALSGLDLLNRAEFTEIHDRLGDLRSAPSPAEVDRRIREHTEVDSALYYFQVRDSAGSVIFRSTNLGILELPQVPTNVSGRTDNLEGVGVLRVCNFRERLFQSKSQVP